MILPSTVTAFRSAGQKSFQSMDGSDLISGARSTACGVRATFAAYEPYR